MVCIHETNVVRVLGPYQNLGTAWKPLSKEEQYTVKNPPAMRMMAAATNQGDRERNIAHCHRTPKLYITFTIRIIQDPVL